MLVQLRNRMRMRQLAFLSVPLISVLSLLAIPTRADVQFIGSAAAPSEPLELWYQRPAANNQWVQALPVGNGRIGAMVFGGVDQERLQLNEDTLWAGGPYDPVNPNAKAALPEVRKLVLEGKYAEAQKLANQELMARPLSQMPYET